MSDDTRDERDLGLAALALDEPDSPAGATPSLDELWDWMAGELPESRAAEVRRHVARDPEVYEQWRQLRLAREEPAVEVGEDIDEAAAASATVNAVPVPDRRPAGPDRSGSLLDRLREWLGPVPLGAALATVAAVGVGIAVIGGGDPPTSEIDFWADWQMPKSVLAPTIDPVERPELGSVLVGMREQMREMSLPAFAPNGRALPGDVDGCAASDVDCAARRETLRELGRLSVVARLECLVGTEGSLTYEHQQIVARILADLGDGDATARLTGPLRTWAEARTRSERCDAVGEVLSRSLIVVAGAS